MDLGEDGSLAAKRLKQEGVRKPGGVRQRQRQRTRQQLIDATIDSLAASGFVETTLAKVSDRAGVSRGLVNFHFTSKDELLVATLLQLEEEYTSHWRAAVAEAGEDPVRRLEALVKADFSPKVCNRKNVSVWYAFFGEARSRPTYVEACQKFDQQFGDALTDACRALVQRGGYDGLDPKLVARTLGALIDSFWRDCMLLPRSFDRDEAQRTCLRFLALVFPRHFKA
jgi:TetR/AcrR family transcriptional repressor of bet genes